MKLKTLTFLFIIGLSYFSQAQELIIFYDGTVECVKLMEEGDADIKYKKYKNQDGPIYSTAANRVLNIVYKPNIDLCSSEYDIIVFKDGTVEQILIIEVEEEIIKYKKVKNLEGPTFSTSKNNILCITYKNGTKDFF